MKALLGYLIKVICFFIFLVLVLSFINNLFYTRHTESDLVYFTGYYLGLTLVFLLFSWLLYKFSKFGSKLIKNTKNKNQINEIEEE
ncbi:MULTISPECIES: hypothetical protein [Flavobacterium]|uniref:Uncharacterized protein n=1 Tax=Flavobacterium jumunjinense TaxID=998845 RepID=A0ABV5GN85_9FLAO|nr:MULTISPECIES: hypothetical protein [Flavobacterium]